MFVGNLAPETEGRDLRNLFKDFGTINDAWVARKPPGFGFVWFEDERDAVQFKQPCMRHYDDSARILLQKAGPCFLQKYARYYRETHRQHPSLSYTASDIS